MLGFGGWVRGSEGKVSGRGARRAATACSVPGAVQPREEPCTRGSAAAPATTPDAEEAVSGAAGALALLAAPLAPGPWVPRIEAAFHCRLRRDASVERRALHELGTYYLVSPGRAATAGGATGPRVTVRALRSPTPRAPSAAARA